MFSYLPNQMPLSYWLGDLDLATAVRSTNPGYCFKCVGWKRNGTTDKGLLIFEKKVQPYAIEKLYGPGIIP